MTSSGPLIGETTSQEALLLAPLVLIALVLTVVALVDLVRRPTVRGNKVLWAIVIVVVGTVGPITYFVFGRKEG